MLKICLERDIDLNSGNPENGITPLMLATELGYHRICELLIDAGADVNASDFLGNTALHMAAQGYGEQTSIIKTLLRRGADPKATNDDGLTPAMLAKRMAKEEHFQLLDVQIEEPVQKTNPDDDLESVKTDQVFSFV